MVGVILTEGPDVYHATFRSTDDIPTFFLYMLGGDDQLYTGLRCSLRAYLGSGDDYAQLNGLWNVWVYGEDGNDTIDVTKSVETLTIDGGDGADRVNFLADPLGPITVVGGAGNDSFYGNGHQFYGTLSGGSGDDFFSGFGNHGDWKITLAGGT